MSWKKYFKAAPTNQLGGQVSPISGGANQNVSYRNYQSQLPDVYIGHPNRVERYNQYENMDMDPEVNAALDILAEFSTQHSKENGTPFNVNWLEQPSDNEINIIRDQLKQWCSLNELNERAFKMFRNVLKYGDQVFLRDPQTFKLFWTEVAKVTKVIVNENEGKKPEQYVIKDVAPNFENLTATQITNSDVATNHPQVGGGSGAYIQPNTPSAGGTRFSRQQNEVAINAEHVVHISLTEGLDVTWPFGVSVLENIFKVFKQKELLEDAIIIYRVQRAPERRIFYIDVGNMPSHMAMSFVERVKNEVHQRRIPTQNGGGQNMADATYNPLSTNEDFFFPQTAEGRGSKVDTLPGGSNLGEITDLHYFTNKLFRGLRVPASYLPTGLDDGTSNQNSFSDGRVGTALIQEWRFNQYCIRLQRMISRKLDEEFKVFLRWRGINIDSGMFSLEFNEPQNFASYRQAEVDGARIGSFTQLEAFPYLSKRFLMTRFLGLSEEEMSDNERMWREEQGDTKEEPAEQTGLRGVGISPGGIAGDMNLGALPDVGAMGGDLGGDMGGDMAASAAPDLGGVGALPPL